jgi:hypothetical protein
MKLTALCIAALVTLIALAGCATIPQVPGDRNLINDVAIPGTTREATLLKMGEPSASFEAGRILTYRIGEDSKGYFLSDRQVLRWANSNYSLVLVFDDRGLLTKHALVPVR